ncbi:hypothetical protein GCM10010358_83770 [Streptomyces minutiscleroticus]|uniref:Uncharacterized protein n=1 Tax=Streptomyces minutiscleroticus TaxID=68238 RepID=A0A918UB88_9ACTN|nr:hypothetical protein [Streptomyces minutiscleroticus]GGY21485.1 hypothetical protein GCM10010358_83770 [Streptomyces minutiscleroticus]
MVGLECEVQWAAAARYGESPIAGYGTASDASFDPFDFPADSIAVQREAAGLHAELRRFQATLPWSWEPHEGWEAWGSAGIRFVQAGDPGLVAEAGGDL